MGIILITPFHTVWQENEFHKCIKRYLPSRGLQHEPLIFPPAIEYDLLTIDNSTIWSNLIEYISFYGVLTCIPWYYSSHLWHRYSYVLRQLKTCQLWVSNFHQKLRCLCYIASKGKWNDIYTNNMTALWCWMYILEMEINLTKDLLSKDSICH